MTFTKESAKELYSRVVAAYPEGGERFTAGTFHSLALNQLKRTGKRINLVDESTMSGMVFHAWKDINNMGAAALSFDKAKAFVESIKSKPTPDLSQVDEYAVAIYLRYQSMLENIDGMDFSDLIVKATNGMMTGEVEPVPGDFMLVDEFQDTDEVGLAWVNEHRRNGCEITVVGDDDQSVYSFRHAMGFIGMERFLRESGASKITLDTTYRCPQEVITPSAVLIAQNVNRIPKRLRTENQRPGSVRRVQGANREDEINMLIESIEQSGEPGQWGVLARSNKVLDAAESQLGAKFSILRNNSKSFWDNKLPGLYLAVCRSLAYDNLVGIDALLRSIGVPDIRVNVMHSRFRCRDSGSMTKYIFSLDAKSHRMEDHLRRMLREWRDLASKKNHDLALEGIKQFLLEHCSVDEHATGATAAKTKGFDKKLLDAACKSLSGLKGELGDRVQYIKQAQMSDGKEDEDSNAVRLLTMHASKGLEFKHVWILACEDGVVPATGSPKEEERRLFYVGMTRAKQNLTLSYSMGEVSPFITEADIYS